MTFRFPNPSFSTKIWESTYIQLRKLFSEMIFILKGCRSWHCFLFIVWLQQLFIIRETSIAIKMGKLACLLALKNSKTLSRSWEKLQSNIGKYLKCRFWILKIPKSKRAKTEPDSSSNYYLEAICHCKMLICGLMSQKTSLNKKTTIIWC